MTIDDLLRCANLLVFEDNTYDDYPYFAVERGTSIKLYLTKTHYWERHL
jgi:hypothetical protein